MHVRSRFLLSLLVAASSALGDESALVICPFDKPMDFSYQAWQDKVVVADGKASLNGLAANGGGGWNAPADLGGHGDDSPALRLRTREGNTATVMTLIMDDTAGRSARWEFPLPAPGDEFVVVTPKGGASLKEPNKLENKKNPEDASPLDLAHIRQYQILGDWSKTVYHVEVDAIAAVAPDADLLAQRVAYAKERAAEAERQARLAAEEAKRVAKERQQRIWWHGKRTERSPKVVHVSLAAPDILALTIRAQHVVHPVLSKYEPQEGDEKKVEKWKDGTVRRARLIRGGKDLGWLMGRELDWFATYEKLEGDPLLEFLVEDPSLYTVSSPDDPAFGEGAKPEAVYRKSMPVDWQLPWGKDFAMRHTVYLRMAKPFVEGKTYNVSIAKLNVQNGDLTFKADLADVRSDTVHVNQIGFRPDDPAKHAFLSVWLGTGGGCELPEGLAFSVLRQEDGKPVFTGRAERILGVDDTEVLCSKPPKNYSRTAVHRLDFSALRTPGTYRIYVAGIGCSYPCEIGGTVWEKAFLVQMKGLYNNRSGTELGPPYSEFRKPRDFHPADGASVTRSTCDMFADAKTSGLVEGDTGEPVPDAWGGYHDAGDWNPRRVSHMSVTLAQLEIFELFPEYMSKLDLRIPRTEGVPDLITEALFEIDCFRRLQLPDGGIPYGIESDGDPSPGEISWLSTQRVYVSAPNIRDSWFYAAVAARAAKLLQPYRPDLAAIYLDSAKRAFAWAEKDYAARKAEGRLDEYKQELWHAMNARNLSALALYDCTADKAYHAIFMEDSVLKDESPETNWWAKHIQLDAAFLYARLDDAKADPEIKKHALVAVTKQAGRAIAYAEANAFNLTTHDRYRPMFGGFFSTSGGTEIARAHYLTGKPEYLAALVRSCQFQSGCNPNNIVYTTGLGANPVKNPLHLDSRSSGQAVPVGLTTFGNVDYWNNKGGFWDWPITSKLKDPMACWPNPYDWPLTEAYFDIFLFVSMNEFVVDTWAPNVLVWGYLAARAPEAAR